MNRQITRQVANVHPSVPGKHRRLKQNPEMPATPALLEGRLNPVLLKFILELQ
jgi:hypothetical protein